MLRRGAWARGPTRPLHPCRVPEPSSPYPSRPAMDISFTMMEGDFQCFTGVWRMQDGSTPGTTRLSYSVRVSPMVRRRPWSPSICPPGPDLSVSFRHTQAWLPVGLITGRIEREISNNLAAVRKYAEEKAAKLKGAPAAK